MKFYWFLIAIVGAVLHVQAGRAATDYGVGVGIADVTGPAAEINMAISLSSAHSFLLFSIVFLSN